MAARRTGLLYFDNAGIQVQIVMDEKYVVYIIKLPQGVPDRDTAPVHKSKRLYKERLPLTYKASSVNIA